MESLPPKDPYRDFSMTGYEIARNLSDFDKLCADGQVGETDYDDQLSAFAQQSLKYLSEGLQTFKKEFMLDVEVETFARSLSGERRENFALRFSELLYASISDPVEPVDAISDRDRLQHAIDLTAVADRMNEHNFYERPNRVREAGDAIIGRAILSMFSLNVDPRTFRIPVRN